MLRGGRLCQADADRQAEIDPERFIRACSSSAFELSRASSDVLSRLVPVAASHLLHARAAPGYERRIDFPAAASSAATQHRVGAAELGELAGLKGPPCGKPVAPRFSVIRTRRG